MDRKGFIGGSDCVQIMQGNWLDLWKIKTGREEPEDLSNNIAVQLGSHTESFNLKWFEKEMDVKLENFQAQRTDTTYYNVPLRATIDATIQGQSAIVEAKHTNSFNTMESVIDYYMPQVQLYSHVFNTKGAYLSVIFGNNKWETSFVAKNSFYISEMMASVSKFWRHVETDMEPIGIDVPEIVTDSILIDNMIKRDASEDNEFVSLSHDYIEHEASAKSFEQAKKKIKSLVKKNEREVYCDLLTIKRDKRGAMRITTRRKANEQSEAMG